MANGKVLNVACPKCKESFNYYESSFRPFCSERCKEVDLGLWFTETYKVASKEQLNEEDMQAVISNLEESNQGGHNE
ncbi:MAG: DNA gyrase inhibitor YacG [Halobacteriovoraceae bacterium]|nr:DNA gyrase inhibitor YacG [Halobacteriovoraceae bacterium]|tara:strand:+ start:12837 stop:13067 length:231 start_codon:yes stop_codon:yes gene_type:complete